MFLLVGHCGADDVVTANDDHSWTVRDRTFDLSALPSLSGFLTHEPASQTSAYSNDFTTWRESAHAHPSSARIGLPLQKQKELS
jgi:hypothetical protein